MDDEKNNLFSLTRRKQHIYKEKKIMYSVEMKSKIFLGVNVTILYNNLLKISIMIEHFHVPLKKGC